MFRGNPPMRGLLAPAGSQRGPARAAPRPPGRVPPRARGRRGITSLFAMLYMLIFSALAIGFYSAVTMAVQVAHNDERSHGAQMAAESGMQFMKYHLGRVKFPSN